MGPEPRYVGCKVSGSAASLLLGWVGKVKLQSRGTPPKKALTSHAAQMSCGMSCGIRLGGMHRTCCDIKFSAPATLLQTRMDLIGSMA